MATRTQSEKVFRLEASPMTLRPDQKRRPNQALAETYWQPLERTMQRGDKPATSRDGF